MKSTSFGRQIVTLGVITLGLAQIAWTGPLGEASTAATEPLTTTTTPPMFVKSFTLSTSSTGTFRLKTPYQAPIFLGLMSILKNPAVTGVTGVITPGTDASHGGSANLQMGTAQYDAIVNFANSHSGQGLFVELVYDNATLTPTDVIYGTT